MNQKTYDVSVTFTDIDAENPLEATKIILKWLEDSADKLIYDVKDTNSNEAFTVDLSEDDENAVLPNNN